MLHPFDQLVELPTDAIRLDCAALHLARDIEPDLDALRYVAAVDALADDVLALRPRADLASRYLAMRELLVETRSYRGNAADYYDTDNFYLHRVLDSGLGVPITLAVIWTEVGRRLHWPLRPVGFPGHFLVRFDEGGQTILVDPFNDGASLDAKDCQALLDKQFDKKVKLAPQMLEPIDTRAVLSRMLQNLRTLYGSRQEWGRLDAVLQRLAALEPTNPSHRQELAALRCREGEFAAAHEQLSAFLARAPDRSARDSVEQTLRQIESAIARLN